MMMKDVLKRFETVLDDSSRWLGPSLLERVVLGTLNDPNGCLSQFANDPSFRGRWEVIRSRLYADDLPWLVQCVDSNPGVYEFADGLPQVQHFFSENGSTVEVGTVEREPPNPDLWWIKSRSLPEGRGISFAYKVYSTVYDLKGGLNARSIRSHLGREEKYTREEQKKWEIVFKNGEFWLRKCCDHAARFVMKVPDDPISLISDIRTIPFPSTLNDFEMVEGGHFFNLRIELPNKQMVNVGRWYANGDGHLCNESRLLNPYGYRTADWFRERWRRIWGGR
jgi:hypothetical protein